MRSTKPLYGHRRDPIGIGPWLAFAGSMFAAAAVWTGLIGPVSGDLAMPVAATLLFACAASLVVAGRQRGEDPARVTYADVAGALTLIGLCAAATIEPDQLARIVATDSTQP